MCITGKAGKEEDHHILNKAAMFIFCTNLKSFAFSYIFMHECNVITMLLTLLFTSGEIVLSVVMNAAIGLKSTVEGVT